MAEAFQTQAGGIPGLQLVGNDSKLESKSTRSDNFAGSETPFSSEFKRASENIKNNVDSGDKPVHRTGFAAVVTISDTVEKTDPNASADESVDHLWRLPSADDKDAIVVAPSVIERQDILEPGIKVPVGATNQPAVAFAEQTLVTDDEGLAPGTSETLVATKAQPLDSALENTEVDAARLKVAANGLAEGNTLENEAAAVIRNSTQSVLEGDGIASGVSVDKSLTGSLVKPESVAPETAAVLQESTSTGIKAQEPITKGVVVKEVLPEGKPVVASSILKQPDLNAKPLSPVDVQPQTVAQLPAAVALNASGRSKAVSGEENKIQATPLAAAVNESDVALAGSLATSGELARKSAKAMSMPSTLVQTADGLMTPTEGESDVAAVSNQVTSANSLTKPAVPELVPEEAIDNTLVLNNLAKQVGQLATQGAQVIEPTIQNAASTVSEAANNMFQALPTGIITAPVVSRSELPANLVTSAPYTVPLTSPDADEALAGNVKWMVTDGVRNAVVNIAPSGMGPISVQIDIENEHMNVSIIAAQGGTREALDAMLPRLREQLGTQGLESVRVDVSDGRSSDGSRSASGQQFGQARGELAGNNQNNSGSNNESNRDGDDRSSNETERQRVSEMRNAAAGISDSGSQNQSLYDVYV